MNMEMYAREKEFWMNRPILVCTLFVAAAVTVGAQEASQSSAYQGVSNPPTDDQITTSVAPTPAPKPPAGHLVYNQPAAPAQTQAQPRSTSTDPSVNYPDPDFDVVSNSSAQASQNRAYANDSSAQASQNRTYANDPDGDIVHLHARPGEIVEGTSIRVRLLDHLSTVDSEVGEGFRTRVVSDVVQDGRVLIPAGAEIDGRVTQVSSGHLGGHGTMHLNPEVVILPDGTRYTLHAEISGTPARGPALATKEPSIQAPACGATKSSTVERWVRAW